MSLMFQSSALGCVVLMALGLPMLISPPAQAELTVAQGSGSFLGQGTQVQFNGQTYSAPWARWQDSAGRPAIGMSDSSLMQQLGVDLLNSNDYRQQPLRWFTEQPTVAATRFHPSGTLRYLDISPLAQQQGWQVQPVGNVLQISAPAARTQAVRVGRQPWGNRVVVELDQPAPWQTTRLTNSRDGNTLREFTLTVNAAALPGAVQNTNLAAGNALRTLKVNRAANQTVIEGTFAGNVRPHIWMLPNPNRLVIDLRPDLAGSRDIAWAPGLRWREQMIGVGGRQYPVTWLAVDPRQARLQPIWGNPNALVGLQPLTTIATQSQAAAAINGGYFTRDRQTPLGAIRRNGQWISSPILNRGVIAWNQQGQFRVGRLALRETLTTASGQTLSVASSDSGYPQRGIARYTRLWGSTYTPILQNEQIITVESDRVTRQQRAASTAIPIPSNGYLLVLRDVEAPALTAGTQVQHQASPTPGDFSGFSEILGGGPLLIENGRVVLNAEAESFRPPFGTQVAPRSGIAQLGDGTILLAASHNRVGGAGPTLREWAEILRSMGAVQALNLDGGSSTTLFLGGQLIDRHPVTAARVQNGIGVFITPPNP
ncbi:phosphodiester glycosidase family protein [Synechococcales cyanobacterium C]|uniref:Phosphodiester glycosidase family protein n=1 Tax=Petrachloros mirabilis ULC683 TaxID=2781853 RepID=A0A8K1ZX19_9CYAN|nr:phosphodiester glycosidase family protein [Petrachloros mirabilis]NCJ05606.1 phosphodiester glycosidase family protein [Petrachloros mirabilis ULC683]